MANDDTFHLALGLWATPPSKLVDRILRRREGRRVDLAAVAADVVAALGAADGVAVRLADAPVDQAQLEVRCAGQGDAPFPLSDVAGLVVARAAGAEPASAVLACRPEVEAMLPQGPRAGEARVELPPTGLLIVASGAKADVMRWYAAALRRLRIPGVAVMARPGYQPTGGGRAAPLTKGVLPAGLLAALDRATGVSYAKAVTLLPLSIVPPDEALPEAA